MHTANSHQNGKRRRSVTDHFIGIVIYVIPRTRSEKYRSAKRVTTDPLPALSSDPRQCHVLFIYCLTNFSSG